MKNQIRLYVAAVAFLSSSSVFAAPIICAMPAGESMTAYVEPTGELSRFKIGETETAVQVDATIKIGTVDYNRYLVSIEPSEVTILFLPASAGSFEDHESFDGFVALPMEQTLRKIECRQGLK